MDLICLKGPFLLNTSENSFLHIAMYIHKQQSMFTKYISVKNDY